MKALVVLGIAVGVIAFGFLMVPFFASLSLGEFFMVLGTVSVVFVTSLYVGHKANQEVSDGRRGMGGRHRPQT